MIEKTLVIIKPDAFSKGKVGKIISKYEAEGFIIEKAKVLVPSSKVLSRHYKDHIGKPFYESLVSFMSSGKVMVLSISGESAVNRIRTINGATNPSDARKGTIRNLYGTDIEANAVHSSEDKQAAKKEIEIWFE